MTARPILVLRSGSLFYGSSPALALIRRRQLLSAIFIFQSLSSTCFANNYTKDRRGRKLGVLGKLGTSENRFSTPSFPFCTIPRTEKSEMKTSGAVSSLFTKLRAFPTPSFPFCTIPKTENSELKTSECSFKPFYQPPSFSNSEFSILHCTQNGKLGDENLGVLFQAFLPNSEFFQLRVFHFALYPKRKTRR